MRRMVVFVLAVLLLAAASSGASAPAASAAGTRTWHLVALGDSIPYGGSYCGHCTPYPTLLGRALASMSGHPIVVTDLGVPGLTAARLQVNVRARSDVRAALAEADIVTITIGHNDTPWNSRHDSCDGARAWFGPYRDARFATYAGHCLDVEAANLNARLRGILADIRSVRHGRPTLVELTTDWNQLIGRIGMTSVGVTASKAVLDRFAAVTCAAARAWSARCGDVYHAFNGSTALRSAGAFLAPDHDHADQRGHQVIADLLAKLGTAPLS